MANYSYMAKIGIDTSGLEAGLKQANTEISTLDRSLKNINSSIKAVESTGGDTLELLQEKEGLLTEEVMKTAEKYEALASIQEEMATAWGDGSITNADFTAYQKELTTTEAKLATLNARIDETVEQIAKQYSALGEVATVTKDYGDELEPIERELQAVNSALEGNEKSVELNSQKQTLLQQAIDKTQSYLEELREKQEEVNEALANNDISESQYREFQREIENTKITLASYITQLAEAEDNTKTLGNTSITVGDLIKSNLISSAIQSGLSALCDALKSAVETIKSTIEETATLGDTIDKQSQILGLSREAYQEWSYVLSQNGADISSLQSGIRTLTNQIESATNGTESAVANFEALGISVSNLANMSSEDIFSAVIDGLQSMDDETSRNALANDLLGRTYQQLIPLFNSTAEETQELKDKAQKLGLVLSDDVVDNAVDLNDEIDTLERTFQSIGAELTSTIMPVLVDLSEKLIEVVENSDAVEKLKDALDRLVERWENGEFEQSIDHLANSVGDLIDSIGDLLADDALPEAIEVAGEFVDLLKWVIDNRDNIVSALEAIAGVMGAIKAAQLTTTLATAATTASTLAVEGSAAATALGAVGTAAATAVPYVAALVAAIGIGFAGANKLNSMAEALFDVADEVQSVDDEIQTIYSDIKEFKTLAEENPFTAWEQGTEIIADVKAELDETKTSLNALESYGRGAISKEYLSKVIGIDVTDLTDNEIEDLTQSMSIKVQALENAYTQYSNKIEELSAEFEGTLYTAKKQEEEAIAELTKTNAGKTNADILAELGLTELAEELAETTEESVEDIEDTVKSAWTRISNEYARNSNTYTQEMLDSMEAVLMLIEDEESDLYDTYYTKFVQAQASYLNSCTSEFESSIKDAWQSVANEYTRNGNEYTEEMLAEMQSILDSITDKEGDLYDTYYTKFITAQTSYNKKITEAQEEQLASFENEAESLIDGIEQTAEAIANAYESAVNDYKLTGANLGETVTDTDGNERFILTDLQEETKKLEEYQASMDALKETGASDELLSAVMDFDYSSGERQQFIDELLAMTDEQRAKYYADYEEYLNAVANTAAYDVQDDIAELETTVSNVIGTLDESAEAYAVGTEVASQYLQGINDVLNSVDSYRYAGILGNSNSSAATADSGSYVSTDTVISISVAGTEVITGTINDYLRNNVLTGGNNTYV